MLRSCFAAVLLLLAGSAPATADGPVRFDDHFTAEATLRLDFVHTGVHDREEINFDALVREGPWPGSRTRLIDTTGYGKYLVTVRARDAAPDDPDLYTRGFASLFGEWQTTDEARRGVRRAFHETVRFPFPRHPITIGLAARDGKGVFQEVARFDVDPASYCIGPSRRAYGSLPVVKLHESGPPSAKLDVLIVGDGYTRAEAEKYRRDLDRFAAAFFESPPFGARRDDVNLRAVEVHSAESGTDEPRKGIFRDTALHTSFDTFGSPRYMGMVDNRTSRDVAGTAPYDTLFILVNTSRYGGAGIFRLYSMFPSDAEYDEYVMVHEFGHSFAGLGDEYYTSGVAYSEFYPKGVEPWEPNLTALADPAHVKWGALKAPATPCPTPEDAARFGDVVGCFEGGATRPRGSSGRRWTVRCSRRATCRSARCAARLSTG